LLTWSLITVAGIVLWGVHLRRARRAGNDLGDRFSGAAPADTPPRAGGEVDPAALTGPLPVVSRGRRSLLRRPVAWLLLAAFGLQCL
ncbi:hypothetical protein, partial [Stenotrophomonas sp. SrG]|uniref:hypothetical protein n=1 Tax=Stenotrophomonas sp. SrG TaxID=3414430 RepID=UPI003CF0F998